MGLQPQVELGQSKEQSQRNFYFLRKSRNATVQKYSALTKVCIFFNSKVFTICVFNMCCITAAYLDQDPLVKDVLNPSGINNG